MDKYLKLIADASRQDSTPLRASSFRADEFDEVKEVRRPSALPSAATIASNSRNPIVAPAVRAIIEAIESDARAKGWPAELLWNAEFWGSPRGLAAVIDESDAISEVTRDYIEIVKTELSILRF